MIIVKKIGLHLIFARAPATSAAHATKYIISRNAHMGSWLLSAETPESTDLVIPLIGATSADIFKAASTQVHSEI